MLMALIALELNYLGTGFDDLNVQLFNISDGRKPSFTTTKIS
jgi:hypothetical protein